MIEVIMGVFLVGSFSIMAIMIIYHKFSDLKSTINSLKTTNDAREWECIANNNKNALLRHNIDLIFENMIEIKEKDFLSNYEKLNDEVFIKKMIFDKYNKQTRRVK